MSKCDRCVSDKKFCRECRDNPIYDSVPKWSHFSLYIPTCPRGYKDCVGDPAYIKTFHPEWYKKCMEICPLKKLLLNLVN